MSLASPTDDERYSDDQEEEEKDDGEYDTSDDTRCLCTIVLKIVIFSKKTNIHSFGLLLLQHCKIKPTMQDVWPSKVFDHIFK